ncbi:MAG: VWA domain-containing protein [Pseudomonadota bacterium]
MRNWLAALLLSIPAALSAQGAPNTILVLDGSGSMWGQIDGVNKIVIAREVVGTLLDDFPQDQNLGLTVYGHRTRGDCSDIETVVAPDAGTLPAIRQAVNGINPRGKTPMTDALIAAAQALRFTEEAATVILVSDGIETCNPDPCAAAAALEQAGIDFTAHVVGFDVTDPEALAQMQCIAGNTGGQFLSASNSSELSSALTQVAVAPEPALGSVAFLAREGAGGPIIEEAAWAIVPQNAQGRLDFTGQQTYELPLGAYNVQVQWARTGQVIEGGFQVAPEGGTVEVVFEPPIEIVPVTFRAVLGAEDGPLVDGPVEWAVTGLGNATGNPLTAEMAEGSYVVTAYWLAQEATSEPVQFIAIPGGREVVVVFEEPKPLATLIAPETAVVGSTIEVAWEGPGAERDVVAITDAGRTDTTYPYRFANKTDVKSGSPLKLLMPTQPGDYVVEYSLGDGNERIAAVPISLTPATATLTAPATVEAGSIVEVAWTGPAYDRDAVGITPADYQDTSYPYRFSTSAVKVGDAPTVRLAAPTEPGSYVIEYAFGQDSSRLTSIALEVVPVAATLTAPESVTAGQTFVVAWTGPGYEKDYIGITAADYEDTGYPYRFVSKKVRVGSDAVISIEAPTEPGSYVVEYALGQDDSRLVAVSLEVTEVGAALTAPASVVAGSTFEVAWTGPGYERDAVGVTAADYADTSYPYRFVTRKVDVSGGPVLKLQAPTEPGSYVVEYALGQDNSRLVAVALEVTALSASVTAPTSAPAGSVIEVAWEGPAYERDVIGITAASYEDTSYPYRFVTRTTGTGEGSPLSVQLPTVPGDYVVEYALGQDNSRLTSVPITVTPVSATLTAPGTAQVGTEIEVAWTGPAYPRDFVGITPADYEDTGYPYRFASRSQPKVADAGGSIVRLTMPEEPGTYVIEYVFGLNNTRLMSIPITVTQ